MNSLEALYQALESPMEQAYQTYHLSCQAGCSQCCESSVGFHLCINPLEWQAMHKCLLQQPPAKRKLFFNQAVNTFWQHQDILNEMLDYFDIQPERAQDPRFHIELLTIAKSAENSQCIFLKDKRCGIYSGRPFTCRVYGNSQAQNLRPFTCDKDWGTMETILLDEKNKLLPSTPFREKLWAIHEQEKLTHKQVMNIWVFCHLDFENHDFLPCRLDQEQFHELANNEQKLARRWARLEQCLSR